jgi:hypothetical protein
MIMEHRTKTLNIPFWWLSCARIGSNNLFFAAGVSVGLAANICVGWLLSHWAFSPWSGLLISLSWMGFLGLGFCLHNIAVCVQNGEANFRVAKGVEIDKHVYIANDCWPQVKRIRGLLWATRLTPGIAVTALVVGVFAFPHPSSQPEKPVVRTQQQSNTAKALPVDSSRTDTTLSKANTNAPNIK